jgi:hypothetical protein
VEALASRCGIAPWLKAERCATSACDGLADIPGARAGIPDMQRSPRDSFIYQRALSCGFSARRSWSHSHERSPMGQPSMAPAAGL